MFETTIVVEHAKRRDLFNLYKGISEKANMETNLSVTNTLYSQDCDQRVSTSRLSFKCLTLDSSFVCNPHCKFAIGIIRNSLIFCIPILEHTLALSIVSMTFSEICVFDYTLLDIPLFKSNCTFPYRLRHSSTHTKRRFNPHTNLSGACM